mmetsp:Transcript_28343/g.71164  ORF Transcript_28343/g.71164 Transcript_28343/m.71164 type:complete len:230 (-) Transcript_28343:931-1620(-)
MRCPSICCQVRNHLCTSARFDVAWLMSASASRCPCCPSPRGACHGCRKSTSLKSRPLSRSRRQFACRSTPSATLGIPLARHCGGPSRLPPGCCNRRLRVDCYSSSGRGSAKELRGGSLPPERTRHRAEKQKSVLFPLVRLRPFRHHSENGCQRCLHCGRASPAAQSHEERPHAGHCRWTSTPPHHQCDAQSTRPIGFLRVKVPPGSGGCHCPVRCLIGVGVSQQSDGKA